MSWDPRRASEQSGVAGGSLLHNAAEMFEGGWWYPRWGMPWTSRAGISKCSGAATSPWGLAPGC